MRFASTKKILLKASKGKYAVAHFNINNMEILQAVVQAAQNKNAPVIIATTQGAIAYAGMNFLFCLVQTAARLASVPICLHLDHGRDIETIKRAIKLGYSSVMFDGSHLPFEENVKQTAKIVKFAHKYGVSVEAELGTIGGSEDAVSSKDIVYTDPMKAKEFVSRTGCDFLAVAIGTSHGAYKFKGSARLQMKILDEIREHVKVPLVLHGASAVPKYLVQKATKYGANLRGVKGLLDSQIKNAIARGICKINTDTDLRLAFDAAVREHLAKNPKDFDPRHILGSARDLIIKVAEKRIELFGSGGKV